MSDNFNANAGRDFTAGDITGRDNITNYYGSPSPQPRRSELPHQPYFFGREAELARIADALHPDSRGWGALIDGPGGIGKTALAVEAGHRADDKQFPTKIFLSAKVRELTPQGEQPLEDFMLPNYIALLAELARELGDDNIEKINPNQRANAARRALSDRHALILIDNLETFDEKERVRVFQFLSRLPASCKAIATSRRRTDVAAEIIRLGRLSQDAAYKLITKLAERNKLLSRANEVERQQLYETAHGNPLLIEWVAGQLGRQGGQCRTIGEACKFIEAAPKGNDPLEFIFGDLLETLTPHEIAVLAVLSNFTSPVEVEWIVKLTRIPERAAQTALEDLTERALLVSDTGARTYLLPPLAATFLRHKQLKIVYEAANQLADAAYDLATEKGFNNFEGFSELSAEWLKLTDAMPILLRGDNTRLQRFCYALHTFLEFYGQWDEWLGLSLQAEKRAFQDQDFENAAWRAYYAGWVYRLREQADDVLTCADHVESYLGNKETVYEALTMRLRGKGLQLQKKYQEAMAVFREMIRFVRKYEENHWLVAIGLNDLGWVEQQAGDRDEAERHYTEALKISYMETDNIENIARNSGTLASTLSERGHWTAAEDFARMALELTDKMGHQLYSAYNCHCLAKALARQGRKAEGLPYAQRAVAIFTKLRWSGLVDAQAVLNECEEGGTTDGTERH